MNRNTWIIAGGAAVGIALGAGVVFATNGDSGTSTQPSASAVPSASANPAISAAPAPTPSPAPSGYLPVNSLGASEIPWNEVGPGWFIAEWVEHPAVYGESAVPVSLPELSVSLLAPDGTWYTGPSLAAAGGSYITSWLGDKLVMFRIDGPGDFYDSGPSGHSVLVSLRDGASPTVAPDALSIVVAIAGDGSVVGAAFSDYGGGQYNRVDSAFTSTPLCGGSLPSSASLSPDGVRLVCFADDPAGTLKTRVLVSNVTAAGGTTVIDTFKSYPDSYGILGWFDDDTFLLRRWAISDSPDAYFTYNISTRKIASYTPPVPSSQVGLGFIGASRTFATHDYYHPGGAAVKFFTESGEPVAQSACGAKASVWYVTSGSYALVTCRDVSSGDWSSGTNALSLIDLRTGVVVGRWGFEDNADQSVSVRGYPANS